jgi:PAS domain S-box-containing protein
MPGKDGLQFLKELRQSGNTTPFIMFTGKGREEVAIQALNLGANQYVNKTDEPGAVYCELAHSVQQAVQRTRAEKQLAESELKYRSIFDNSEVAMFRTRLDGSEVLDFNQKFLSILGRTNEEVQGKPLVIHWADPLELQEMVRIIQAEGLVKDFECKILTKQGEVRTCRTSIKLYPEKGILEGSIIDITAEKASEEARARFKNIADIAGDWIWEVDSDGRYTYSNPSVERVLGYLPEEVLGRHFYDFYPPEELEKLKNFDVKIFARKERFTTFVHKDGHLVLVETRGVPVVTPDGKILGYRGSDRDVTEAKQAQKALKESEEKFKQLFTQNPEATCYLDADLHILDVNPRFCELFRYSLEEIKAKSINVIVPEDKMDDARILRKNALDKHVYFDTVRKRKDGLLVSVSVSAASMKIMDELTGYVMIYKDISELKKSEHDLAVMNEKLRVVGGLTRHDVRNKLSTITGNAYLLKKQLSGDSNALEKLKDMEAAVEQTVRILDFAKTYEMLGVEELVYVDVGKTVDEAASLFSSLDGVKVVNDCRGLNVLADSLLRQLFYNLMDDSLKYGKTITQVRIHYQRTDGNQLELVYEDDGVGVAEEAKHKLFAKGYTTGKGSGYGLYLIKKMVEVYDWTIQETGEPGKGSRFIMTIPKINPNGKESYIEAQQ